MSSAKRLAWLALALASWAGASAAEETVAPAADPAAETATEPIAPPAPPQSALTILGEEVAPGTQRRLVLLVGRSFAGADLETPIIVAHGAFEGPTLCLTAGIHGDEVNGVEVVRRVVSQIDSTTLRGTVIAAPIVNLPAFRRGSRYLPDRRDLNRFFPGSEVGSAASRIAHALFSRVLAGCDALVDFHTGSFHRTNIHHLRADLRLDSVQELALGFGASTILHKPPSRGTLRRAATDAGIPAITLEAGEPSRFSESEVALGVEGVLHLLAHLGMHETAPPPPELEPVLYGRSHWARADEGGILVSNTALGEVVERDQVLGTVINPLTAETTAVRSPAGGLVVGKAFDQLVMPGFAAFHVAVPGGLEHLSPYSDETRDEIALERSGLDPDERPE